MFDSVSFFLPIPVIPEDRNNFSPSQISLSPECLVYTLVYMYIPYSIIYIRRHQHDVNYLLYCYIWFRGCLHGLGSHL